MAEIAKMINGKVCLKTAAICDILGITHQAMSQWEDQGCPKASRGWWSIKDVLAWRGMVSPSGLNTAEEVEKISLAQQKLEAEVLLKKNKAEESEFKNAVVRGEYIKKTDITSELQRFFVTLKMSMSGFSRMIATELSAYVDVLTARKIEKMISEVTMDALEQISINGVYEASKNKKRKS